MSLGLSGVPEMLGASGARITGAVTHQPAAAGAGQGLAALCIGAGGQALALER